MTTPVTAILVGASPQARRFANSDMVTRYGNGWYTFDDDIELFDSPSVPTSTMVMIYNSLADTPVQKFSDRKTAARRTWAIIEARVPITTEGATNVEANTNTEPNQDNVLETMKKSAEAERTAAQQKAADKAKAAEAKKAEQAKKAEERAAAKAAKDAEKAKAAEQKAAAKAAKDAEKAAAKAAKQAAGGTGRKSALAGKLLKHSIAKDAEGVVKNPRRPDSHGYRSMQIVINAGDAGITTEDYVKAGGRMNDLHWDVDHGNVKVEEVSATPTA